MHSSAYASGYWRCPSRSQLGASVSIRRRPVIALPKAAEAQPSTSGGREVQFKGPHSGFHYDGSPRRFFEGWYWKVQIPDTPHSFALISSIEDPGGRHENSGVCVQVIGPFDGYICQFSKDVSSFWASRNDLQLGAGFKAAGAASIEGGGVRLGRMLSEDAFFKNVELGFQASYTQQTGCIVSYEGAAGAPASSVPKCSWGLSIWPISGWGATSSQKATAGWLSLLSIFEPHWQVLMAEGLASGWFQWGDQRYEFQDAPTYAEKNWGGGFPSKWWRIQSNTWDGHPGLALTALGARRALALGLPDIDEDVGLMGVHLPDGGPFIELVPWNGVVEWDVDPWGAWLIRGRNDEYDVLVEATCPDAAGTVMCAPTINQGLAPFCKNTFYGRCRLRVWRTEAASYGRPQALRREKPIVDATTPTGALEVGGGPWWAPWSAKATMKEPFRSMAQLPIDVGALGGLVPAILKPPGL